MCVDALLPAVQAKTTRRLFQTSRRRYMRGDYFLKNLLQAKVLNVIIIVVVVVVFVVHFISRLFCVGMQTQNCDKAAAATQTQDGAKWTNQRSTTSCTSSPKELQLRWCYSCTCSRHWSVCTTTPDDLQVQQKFCYSSHVQNWLTLTLKNTADFTVLRSLRGVWIFDPRTVIRFHTMSCYSVAGKHRTTERGMKFVNIHTARDCSHDLCTNILIVVASGCCVTRYRSTRVIIVFYLTRSYRL